MEKENRGSVRLDKKAVVMLQHYGWPGNVRELANLLERLAILYPHAVIEAEDLPEKFHSTDYNETIILRVDDTLIPPVQHNLR